jgi:3-oxoacyl-[acyl-carrier protein] reductase
MRPRTVILGASRGLGKCIADQCAARGERTVEGASSFINNDDDPDRETISCNLESPEHIESFLVVLGLSSEPITRFFWVAGVHLQGPFADACDADVAHAVDINFRNPLPICIEIWHHMLDATRHPSTFTIISSTSGTRARQNEAVYAATKHAQVGLARSLGLEAKGTNIKVSLFMPGGMQTSMWDPEKPEYASFLDPSKVAARILQRIDEQTESYYEEEIPRGSL